MTAGWMDGTDGLNNNGTVLAVVALPFTKGPKLMTGACMWISFCCRSSARSKDFDGFLLPILRAGLNYLFVHHWL